MPHLIFLIFVLFSAVMTRFVLESLSSRRYKPPFTVMMGLWGVLLGIVNTEGLDEGGLWHQSVGFACAYCCDRCWSLLPAAP